MQRAAISLNRARHSKGNCSFGKKKLSKSKVYMLPILSAFFVEHNIKPGKKDYDDNFCEKNTRTCLQMKFDHVFQICLTPDLCLPEAYSQSKLKMFLRRHKRTSLNLL